MEKFIHSEESSMRGKTLGALALLSGILVILLIATVFLFGLTNQASAQGSSFQASLQPAALFHHGPGGFGAGGYMQGLDGEGDSYLAEALGISVDELQAAREQAVEAAIQQAVESGALSEEQADRLRDNDRIGKFGMGFFGHRIPGMGAAGAFDYQTLLAEALGISVSELESAQQAAHAAAIGDAVASGDLTQEQADLLLARHALRAIVDQQALAAEALGITVPQLQAYQEDGLRMAEILAELGLSADEFQAARQAAYEAALAQAVADGVITQEQAEALQSGTFPGQGGFGGCEGMGGGRGRHGGGMRGFPGGGSPRWSDPGTTTSGDV
jgi:hypothetical protein